MSIATSYLASVARLGFGRTVGPVGPRPQKMLELYEFEACPFCRKVREALTILDLEVLVRPCPRDGVRFRPEAIARGGQRKFPLLVDPNEDLLLYESNDIIRHLYARYGTTSPPLAFRLGPLGDVSSGVASAFRPGHGRRAKKRRAHGADDKPLELWSFEVSPFCRVVRETLSELELPYVLHNIGKGSARRPAFLERTKKLQFPYLEDPNTGRTMFESLDIVAYVEATYGEGATEDAGPV